MAFARKKQRKSDLISGNTKSLKYKPVPRSLKLTKRMKVFTLFYKINIFPVEIKECGPRQSPSELSLSASSTVRKGLELIKLGS